MQKNLNQTEGDGQQCLVTLGRITGPYGVRGWVKVYSETQPKQNILNYAPWQIRQGKQLRQVAVETGRLHGKTVIAKLVGCDDRNAAEDLKGAVVLVSREALPSIDEPGTYYWADLEGVEVKTVEGELLGVIHHLMETGSNDVMVVNGDRERLIPFIREQVVKQVDLQNREMIVDWDPAF
ncbi:MAG: ribosome maturation factor RimM [bacterium]